jgi:Holliday junction resolvasome RuvABC endonuclease subunit
MVRLQLSITKDIRHDDEYDAIAVGLTHLTHTRTPTEG